MATNPYVNKVISNNTTLIDLTSDTITAADLAQGKTAHDASGAAIVGTAAGGKTIASVSTEVVPVGHSQVLLTAEVVEIHTSNEDYHTTVQAVLDATSVRVTDYYINKYSQDWSAPCYELVLGTPAGTHTVTSAEKSTVNAAVDNPRQYGIHIIEYLSDTRTRVRVRKNSSAYNEIYTAEGKRVVSATTTITPSTFYLDVSLGLSDGSTYDETFTTVRELVPALKSFEITDISAIEPTGYVYQTIVAYTDGTSDVYTSAAPWADCEVY